MFELSLHILDLAQNSVSAGAKRIRIAVAEDTLADTLSITIADNGCGMDADFLRSVTDPFTTTRVTRKVGLGIPLMKLAAEQTGGSFEIQSAPGNGTELKAVFIRSSVDRAPLGDMAGTMTALIMQNPDIGFVYERSLDSESFRLDLDEVRDIMGDVDLASPDMIGWFTAYINENEQELTGG